MTKQKLLEILERYPMDTEIAISSEGKFGTAIEIKSAGYTVYPDDGDNEPCTREKDMAILIIIPKKDF